MTEHSVEGMAVTRPISYIRVAVLTVLMLIGLVAVVVGVFFGAVPALLTFSALLLLAGVYHVGNLFKLVRWLRTPVDEAAPLPRAFGLWDNVFAEVNLRSRSASTKQERLSAALERFRALR